MMKTYDTIEKAKEAVAYKHALEASDLVAERMYEGCYRVSTGPGEEDYEIVKVEDEN
ncbi:MAG: hypothetical protein AABN95_16180 [Acidobacteriota bacterium]